LLTEFEFQRSRTTEKRNVKDLKGSGSDHEVGEEKLQKALLRVDTLIMTQRIFLPLGGNNFGLRGRDIGVSLYGLSLPHAGKKLAPIMNSDIFILLAQTALDTTNSDPYSHAAIFCSSSYGQVNSPLHCLGIPVWKLQKRRSTSRTGLSISSFIHVLPLILVLGVCVCLNCYILKVLAKQFAMKKPQFLGSQ
jgi:hypothetical protein